MFAGSSIIEEGPFGEMFPDFRVVNRGIGADTTTGLLKRLDDIIAIRPAKLFLYIGGNDRSRMNDSAEAAYVRVVEIINRVQAGSPETQIYIHTLFPREQQHAQWIDEFNTLIRQLDGGEMVRVVDVHPLALGENGAIDPALTNDGIHLLPEGYRRWQRLLQQEHLPPAGSRND